ncbi:MAG: PEGA domain-containing protein [Deltaproteobacteria bacterium]|nr:PEGA domain-containing protein [Deltaproteobacteria bacterium]
MLAKPGWGRLALALSFLLLGVFPRIAEAQSPAPLRVDGLGSRPRDRILVFVVRGEGIDPPVAAFHEVARQTVESHLHAKVISLEEAFVGGDLQKELAICRGEDLCYARLAGPVDAAYLLIVTASRVGELEIVGARVLDLGEARAIGNAIDPLQTGESMLAALPARIQAAVPPAMWEPFGRLKVSVDQPGAEVSIGGHVVGVTPLAPLGGLPPGTYAISARKAGFDVAETSARVSRDQETAVSLQLVPEASSPSWIWWALGAAVLVGGTVAIGVVLGSGGEPTFCSAPPGGCP